ncbi:MAG: hypothetical protein ACRDT6_25390 [Micromonosporaceae bacterium]
MARRRSARIVVAAAGVVGFGSLALLAAPAMAANPTVTFDGGCSLLASTSEPDKTAVTTQKSEGVGDVDVLNSLGVAAVPHVNGSPVTSGGKDVVVADGDTVTLGFATESAKLTMVPKCGLLGLDTNLSKKHSAATITTEEAADQPQQPGTNPGGNPGTDPGSQPGGTNPGGGTAAPGQPDAGDRPIAPHDPVARGAVPPADSEGRVGSGEGGTSDEDPDAAPPVSDGDSNAGDRDSVNPVVKSNSTRGPGTTTLALIALVCLLGVGVAALRTIVVGRPTGVRSV